MPEELQQPKRIAWVAGGLLLAAGIAFFVFVPKDRDWKGMGFSLLMDKQRDFRRELIHEDRHINELEVWQIQDELARRAGLSRDGVKGLVLRAVNAKEPWMRIDALMLSGNPEDAAPEAVNLLNQLQQTKTTTPEAAARLLRVRGDAAWRQPAADNPAGELYSQALTALGNANPALQTEIQLDLASYHWSIATFKPENPRDHLEQTLRAASEAAKLIEKRSADGDAGTRLDLTAALRLQGNAHLRLGVLQSEEAPDAGLRDPAQLAQATDLLTRAAQLIDKAGHAGLWAGLQHDLGVALTERAVGERMDQGHLTAAIAAFDEALGVRGEKQLGDGRVDVRKLEQQLISRAETQAFRAQALALLGTVLGQDPAAGQHLQEAVKAAKAALELSTSADPGPAWIVAKRAQAQAETEIANASPSTADAAMHVVESIDANLAALKEYPLSLEGEPGVPSQRTLLLNLTATCQDARARRDMPGLLLKLQEVEEVVRPIAEKFDRTPHVETFRAASAALGSALVLHAELTTNPDQRAPLLQEADSFLLRAAAARQEGQQSLTTPPTTPDALNVERHLLPARESINPWRVPWPRDRLINDQLQRAEDLLHRLGGSRPALPPPPDTPKRP